MYCWLNPEISASCSCVRPFSCLIRHRGLWKLRLPTYADRFDTYSGEQLEVTGARPYGSDVVVQTKIVKSNGEATALNYLMRQNQGAWQISDVYLEGTISQLAVQRSEFSSILRREGVDGLVMALNRKVDLLQSVARSP
jgi:phospholipid transport system substrate-binding protein